MQIFFPVIGCHFKLEKEITIKLLTNKNNAKFLGYLNVLPGCLPISAWEKNLNIQTVEAKLEKNTMMTIDKIVGKQLEAEVHFSVYVDGVSSGKKHKFAMLLKDINNKFQISY